MTEKRVLFVSSLLQCLQQPDLELGKARSIGTPSWSPRTVVGTQALELSTLLPQVLISRKLASQVESRFQPGTLMWKAGSSSQAKNGCSHWTFLLTLFLKIENLRLSGSDYKGIVYFSLQRRKKTPGNIFSFLFCLFFRPHYLCGACRCSPSPLIIPEVWRTRLFLSSAGVCEKLILCFSTVIQMLRLQAGG